MRLLYLAGTIFPNLVVPLSDHLVNPYRAQSTSESCDCSLSGIVSECSSSHITSITYDELVDCAEGDDNSEISKYVHDPFAHIGQGCADTETLAQIF